MIPPFPPLRWNWIPALCRSPWNLRAQRGAGGWGQGSRCGEKPAGSSETEANTTAVVQLQSTAREASWGGSPCLAATLRCGNLFKCFWDLPSLTHALFRPCFPAAWSRHSFQEQINLSCSLKSNLADPSEPHTSSVLLPGARVSVWGGKRARPPLGSLLQRFRAEDPWMWRCFAPSQQRLGVSGHFIPSPGWGMPWCYQEELGLLAATAAPGWDSNSFDHFHPHGSLCLIASAHPKAAGSLSLPNPSAP